MPLERRPRKTSLRARLAIVLGIVALLGIGGLTAANLTICAAPASNGAFGCLIHAPFAITSASNDSPDPLTAVTLQVGGLTSGPVTVNFSGKGFSTSEGAIRVGLPDNVIIATPVDFDKKSGAVVSGQVAVVLEQNGRKTPAYNLQIQTLPSFTSSALPLGTLSHAFLVYDALQQGFMINQLEAADIRLGTKSTTTIAGAESELKQTLMVLNNVDRVSRDGSLVISVGKLPSGANVTFDKNTVATMDSIFGDFMLQQYSSVVKTEATVPASQGSEISLDGSSTAGTVTQLKAIWGTLDNAKTAYDTSETLQKSNNEFDNGLAVVNAGVAFSDASYKTTIGKPLGVLIALGTVYDTMLSAAASLGQLEYDTSHGGDPSALELDNSYIQSDEDELKYDVISISGIFQGTPPEDESALFQVGGVGVAFSDFAKALAGAVEGTAEALVTGALDQGNPVEIDEFAIHDGTFHGALDYATYEGFGVDQAAISTLQDPDGNSVVVLPTDITDTNYGDMLVKSVDPLTGKVRESRRVDLSELNTAPVVPTVPSSVNLGRYGTVPAGTYQFEYNIQVEAIGPYPGEHTGWVKAGSGTSSSDLLSAFNQAASEYNRTCASVGAGPCSSNVEAWNGTSFGINFRANGVLVQIAYVSTG